MRTRFGDLKKGDVMMWTHPNRPDDVSFYVVLDDPLHRAHRDGQESPYSAEGGYVRWRIMDLEEGAVYLDERPRDADAPRLWSFLRGSEELP